MWFICICLFVFECLIGDLFVCDGCILYNNINNYF